MRLPLLAMAAVLFMSGAQAASLSYSVDLSNSSGSIRGTYTVDTVAKTVTGFDLDIVAVGGSLLFGGFSSTLHSEDGTRLPIRTALTSFDTVEDGDHYVGKPSDGINLLSLMYTANAANPARTDNDLAEVNQFRGPRVTKTYTIQALPDSGPTRTEVARQFRDLIAIGGADLYRGSSTPTLGFSPCRQEFLVQRVYQPFDNVFFNDAFYSTLACASIVGQVTQIPLVDYTAGGTGASTVPLPASALLLLAGLGGLAVLRRRRKG